MSFEDAEVLDKNYDNEELREMLYETIVEHGINGVDSYESDAEGVEDSENILRGIHIAEMLVAVQPIKREARKEGLFSRLNPF